MSRFFIDRPVAANVLAWLTVLIGIVAFVRLPIERYPPIVPPTVQVRASYPGASAQVVADTVAAPIEQQVNGVEGMLYLSSTSASDGSYALTITFEVGTDLDLAQVQVQNRVATAEPLLPEDVRRQGLTTKKQSTSILLVVSLTSPDGSPLSWEWWSARCAASMSTSGETACLVRRGTTTCDPGTPRAWSQTSLGRATWKVRASLEVPLLPTQISAPPCPR